MFFLSLQNSIFKFFYDNINQKQTEEFTKHLKGCPQVKVIRNLGLMIGIELDQPCGDLTKLALDQGLLINVTADKVIRLLPPLVINEAEAKELVDDMQKSQQDAGVRLVKYRIIERIFDEIIHE